MALSETECKSFLPCAALRHTCGWYSRVTMSPGFLWMSSLIITHIPFAVLAVLSCELMVLECCTQCFENPRVLCVNGTWWFRDNSTQAYWWVPPSFCSYIKWISFERSFCSSSVILEHPEQDCISSKLGHILLEAFQRHAGDSTR